MSITVCRDTSDALALYLPQRLYLKSYAKLNISVQLSSLKVHGKALSNWELMEKLRKFILPETFSYLKVSKHTTEVIRFDAELECRDKLNKVISRLEDRVITLTDYPESLKVRASEAKSDFPITHSWDSFFRDATDMDEMKPGERPDTIHISNLPIRWFVNPREQHDDAPPSESIFKRVFEKFGAIRQVDVPVADPYRMQMKSTLCGITTPAQDQGLYFEGYVQFNEYVAFVRCMDALRGRKLLRKRDDLAEWCAIKVDFDKTKHMTDAAVKRRSIVRERLIARQRAKNEEEKQEIDKVAKREAKERLRQEKMELEKLERMREREERRKKKQLAKIIAKDNVDVDGKYAEEECKLLKAQRKLQAIRLLEELFKRIEIRSGRGGNPRTVQGAAHLARQQEECVERQREVLQQARAGRIVIRSALETKKPKHRTSSISSISDDERPEQKRYRLDNKLNAPDHEMEYRRTMGVWGGVPGMANMAGMAGMGMGMGVGMGGFPYPQPPHHMFYNQMQHEFAAVVPGSNISSATTPFRSRGGFYRPRGMYRGRGRGAAGAGAGAGAGPAGGRGRPRMPYFEGPDAAHLYYKYFKRLTEAQSRNDHDDRCRTRSRSRSRSRTRSRTRSRSHSRSRRRSRSYSRSRSHSRHRSRSRPRRHSYSRSRSRSRSRRSRSRSRRSRSHKTRSKSRDHHSKSNSRRSRTKSRSKSKRRSRTPVKQAKNNTNNRATSVDGSATVSPSKLRPRERSKSWSLPKDGERKSWSQSPPKDKVD